MPMLGSTRFRTAGHAGKQAQGEWAFHTGAGAPLTMIGSSAKEASRRPGAQHWEVIFAQGTLMPREADATWPHVEPRLAQRGRGVRVSLKRARPLAC